jgi:hypothetical protein
MVKLLTQTLYNIILTVQEDISLILFLLFFHETSSIDRYNEDIGVMQTQVKKHFKLNSIILKNIQQIFEICEYKRQITDKNLKFNTIFKSLDNNIKEILNEKFRIYWNMKWHGGTIDRLIEDLLYNTKINES